MKHLEFDNVLEARVTRIEQSRDRRENTTQFETKPFGVHRSGVAVCGGNAGKIDEIAGAAGGRVVKLIHIRLEFHRYYDLSGPRGTALTVVSKGCVVISLNSL